MVLAKMDLYKYHNVDMYFSSWLLVPIPQQVAWFVAMTVYTIYISSPEPKAHGELIVYQSSRRLCVCLSVNIFKLEYLRNRWANCNQILSEASLGRGKGGIRFWTSSDRNSGVHGNG